MRKERTHYSLEFKIKAVELSNQRGSLMSVAQELNISRETLKRWKQEYNAGKFNGDVPNAKIRSAEHFCIYKNKVCTLHIPYFSLI
jgi:transposase